MTKLTRKGQVKIPGYEVYESIRSEKGGGGFLTAITKEMSSIGEYSIEFINAYGKSEGANEVERINFMSKLEDQLVSAKLRGNLICCQLDANSKLGKEIIDGDPHSMSANGDLLYKVIKRNNLIPVNATDKCSGVITRQRILQSGVVEESVIDYFLVCHDLFNLITKMTIERSHVMTKFSSTKGVKSNKESDHFPLVLEGNIKWKPHKNKTERIEIFDFKDRDGLKTFKEMTSGNSLKECFESNENFLQQADKWFKTLLNCVHRSFKKIRLTNKPKKGPESDLLKEMTELKKDLLNNKNDDKKRNEIEVKLDYLKDEISTNCSERNKNIFFEHINKLSDVDEGFNAPNMWKIKKKLCPKAGGPPMAKKDKSGNLVTDPEKLKSLYMDTYVERLSHRKISPDMSDIFDINEKLFNLNLKISKYRESKPWTKKDLCKVLKSLKLNKSRDPHGLVFELYKEGTAGDDLLDSLLILLNTIKKTQKIPDFHEAKERYLPVQGPELHLKYATTDHIR